MTKCRICKRILTNPVSVEIGIGPVCRGGIDDKQGEFDFMRNAEYEIVEYVHGEYIFIRDVGKECRSVTNDAEWVVEQLIKDYGIPAGVRIFYDDSDGRTDELLHDGSKFTGFKAGHEGVKL